jgi:NAD(P)H dehydrogenase (quinone)
MTRVLALTGATGALGGRVAAQLAGTAAEEDVTLRLVVRDPSRAPSLPGVEAVGIPGGYADGPALTAALAGVHTLFLVSAAEAEDRLAQHRTAVDAAAAAGVERVVYTSFLGAAPDATFTLARTHAATEERLTASGMRWTALRNSMYADFLPFFATVEDGAAVIAAPAGDGAVALVARDDAADVAAAVLRSDDAGLDRRALDVTGPQALTLAQAAAVLAEVCGRPVTYRPQTVAEAWATRRPSGHPDWEVEGWVTSYTAIAAGELATVSDVVPALTGRPARTLATVLREHPGLWRALRG